MCLSSPIHLPRSSHTMSHTTDTTTPTTTINNDCSPTPPPTPSPFASHSNAGHSRRCRCRSHRHNTRRRRRPRQCSSSVPHTRTSNTCATNCNSTAAYWQRHCWPPPRYCYYSAGAPRTPSPRDRSAPSTAPPCAPAHRRCDRTVQGPAKNKNTQCTEHGGVTRGWPLGNIWGVQLPFVSDNLPHSLRSRRTTR